MIRFPQLLLPLAVSLLLTACSPTPAFYEAQNLHQKPFNQLDLAGNACGPAALLNSWRFGSEKWQKLSGKPANLTDRERIRTIARGPAMRESSSLPGRARWSKKGINLLDLRDVANEIGRADGLPTLQEKTLFLSPGETQEAHLQRVHSLFARSLSSGFPPILSVRQFVKRGGQWIAVHGHFVTISFVPGKIPSGENGFEIRYIDPFGGNFRDGKICISSTAFLGANASQNPNLKALFPKLNTAQSLVRPGETTFLAVSAVLGNF